MKASNRMKSAPRIVPRRPMLVLLIAIARSVAKIADNDNSRAFAEKTGAPRRASTTAQRHRRGEPVESQHLMLTAKGEGEFEAGPRSNTRRSRADQDSDKLAATPGPGNLRRCSLRSRPTAPVHSCARCRAGPGRSGQLDEAKKLVLGSRARLTAKSPGSRGDWGLQRGARDKRPERRSGTKRAWYGAITAAASSSAESARSRSRVRSCGRARSDGVAEAYRAATDLAR